MVLQVFSVTNHPVLVDRQYAYVQQIGVVQELKRSGVGSALLRFAVEYCRKRKIHQMELDVSDFNREASEFFESSGFLKLSTKMGLILG